MTKKNIFYNTDNQIEGTENTKNLCFKKTILFFYNYCIKRVDNSRINKGLKYIEVCNTEDRALVSNFFNGKCTNNNPFLITKKIMGYKKDGKTLATDESGTYIGIINTLDFKSAKEILWGTHEEIENYLYTLYLLIMEELPKYCSEYYAEWENVLFDYVPYSKYKTLYDIKEDLQISLTDTYGVYDEDVSKTKIAIHQINAILFFFRIEKFRNEFKAAFIEFCEEQKSFTHIDIKFKENFIIQKFIPLLRKHKPTHDKSLGLRVRDLLNNDLRSVPELLSSEYSEKTQDKIKRMKNSATSKYINELEKIHEMEFGYLFS